MKLSHSFSPAFTAEISRMNRAMIIAAVSILTLIAAATAGHRGGSAEAGMAAQCLYLVRPSSQSVAAQGGTGSVTILTADNCAWTATSNAPWIAITSSSSGTVLSQGRVNYSVLPNTETSQRIGTLTVGGVTVTVTQAGSTASSCVVTAINTGQSVNGSLSPSDCQSALRIRDGVRPRADRYSFDATAGQAFLIAIDSTDIDTYLYLVDANGSIIAENDDSRAGAGSRIPASGGFYVLPASGRFQIEVTAFSSDQQGNYALSLSAGSGSCTYSINPNGQSNPAGGGTGSVTVNTQAGCSWGAVSNNGWLSIAAGITSGPGPGMANYTVAANSGLARTGSLTVAGLNFIVTQAGTNGAACPGGAAINPSNAAPGGVITLTGTNFTGVSAVKFANNLNASFNVLGDTQIIATVPSGAVTGPITINKATCPDAQTSIFTINGLVASVSAASYASASLAPESIVAAFGVGLATGAAGALTIPLPTMLEGATVKVRDSAGTERLAPLLYASPSQINYVVPAGTQDGMATITTTVNGVDVSTGTMVVTTVAPGLFSGNSTGQGVAAGSVLRVKPNGDQIPEPILVFDQASGQLVTTPIDLGPEGDLVFLILYGTGWRFRSSLPATSVTIDGVSAGVSYLGVQPYFVGLDQANVLLPRTLAGRGEVDVVMTVNGKVSNKVRVRIK